MVFMALYPSGRATRQIGFFGPMACAAEYHHSLHRPGASNPNAVSIVNLIQVDRVPFVLELGPLC
jgi:hypothetical protein